MIFAIFINPDNFPYVFSFTYFTSIIIAFVYALIAGRKLTRKPQQWALTVGCTFLSLILFSKLGSIPVAQWWNFISDNTNNTCQHKTILGGLIGAIVVFLLLRKYFEFSWKTLDVFALLLPFCAAWQRIGCLVSGCCFGNVTHASFSFQYSVGSAAYLAQLEHGLISSDYLMSLPVIPCRFII
nr:prolipoprotein diacylglyceryl transferase [Bacteroidota bacterium]